MIEIYGFILLVCGLCCAWTSYKIGRKEGAEAALNILYQQKIICYDNKGNIKPNPFFDHEPWVNVEEEL